MTHNPPICHTDISITLNGDQWEAQAVSDFQIETDVWDGPFREVQSDIVTDVTGHGGSIHDDPDDHDAEIWAHVCAAVWADCLGRAA